MRESTGTDGSVEETGRRAGAIIVAAGGSAKRAYHHTAPVNNLYALHESLLMLREEGLEPAHQRHRSNHQALVSGLEAMGLSMAVAAEYRLPQLNAVNIPDGVDDASVRATLLNDFDL